MNFNSVDNVRLQRFTFLLVALLVLLVAGCGGGGGGGGSTSNVVTGIVKDSLNGDVVVQNATVTIGGISGKTRTVDNANSANPVGSFSLVNVPIGKSVATVTLPTGEVQSIAFLPAVSSGTNASLELFVNIGQVSGRILRSNGQPASNAFVTISSTAETFQTNGDGTFLATLVPKGTTQLFAVEGTSSVQKTITVNYGDTAIGDVKLIDDPNPNPPGQPYTLYGTVNVTGIGKPAGTNVLLFRNGVQIEATVTDGNGSYFFYVPVGTYTVRAVRTTFQDAVSGDIHLTNASTPIKTDLTMVSN